MNGFKKKSQVKCYHVSKVSSKEINKDELAYYINKNQASIMELDKWIQETNAIFAGKEYNLII